MNTQSPPVSAYKILVAYAFDRSADPALVEGLNLASRHPDCELHVVHVTSAASDQESAEAPRPGHSEQTSEILRKHVEDAWQQAGPVQVIGHIRTGDPAEAILQVTVDLDADILVVGSHRRNRVQKWVLGSVAQKVLRDAHCPVLVALPKDYSGTVPSPRMEPPCDDCLALQAMTGDASSWCERHVRAYLPPHIYVPRDTGRSSVLPTY